MNEDQIFNGQTTGSVANELPHTWHADVSHASRAKMKPDSNSCQRDVVLSIHPLSSQYKRRLEGQLGRVADYVLASGLRALGVAGALRRIRSLAPERMVLAYEDEDSRVILPVLQCIAAFTRGKRVLVSDPEIRIREITLCEIAGSVFQLVGATVHCLGARFRARRELAALLRRPTTPPKEVSGRDILYLNTNLWFGVKAGGSVGHIAGVVNALNRDGWSVTYAAVSDSPVIDPAVQRHILTPQQAHGLPPELNHYRFSQIAFRQALELVREKPPAFIYQRMSIGNYTGAHLSNDLGIPLVLEYNGSEVWTARHWGRPMIYEQLALEAERASLLHAQLVVTVSEALANQLEAAGVAPEKILWYPNCVDADVFDPARFGAADNAALRRRHGLFADDIVIAFIGTFGKWHGIDVLARAIRELVDTHRAWLDSHRVRFLIVGDGQLMPQVRDILGDSAAAYAVLTGLVDQREAAAFLAASDAVVSPHVANPDGTPFFGSPTKLFEYMAMAKPILASDLDQIGQVLRPALRLDARSNDSDLAVGQELSVLVQPGSVDDIINGVRLLVENPDLRTRLGENARSEVLRKYLWRHHVEAILERLPGAKMTTAAT